VTCKNLQSIKTISSPDGSVDIYFGPAAPAGKESNWVSTKAGGRFELIFRLYGPDKSFLPQRHKGHKENLVKDKYFVIFFLCGKTYFSKAYTTGI
jgi:hypothetical protein